MTAGYWIKLEYIINQHYFLNFGKYYYVHDRAFKKITYTTSSTDCYDALHDIRISNFMQHENNGLDTYVIDNNLSHISGIRKCTLQTSYNIVIYLQNRKITETHIKGSLVMNSEPMKHILVIHS